MIPSDRQPVLVTGSHRSGTTWLGRMLALSSEFAYVQEPFNVPTRPTWLWPPEDTWYRYVCEENEVDYLRRYDRIIQLRYPLLPNLMSRSTLRAKLLSVREATRALNGSLARRRALVKDPLALFSAEWISSRYGAEVLVMIRHPAAFVASVKRQNWAFDFSNFARQELLMRDLLSEWEGEIVRAANATLDIVDQGILLWKVLYGVAMRQQDRHPDWQFLLHEEVSANPVERCREIYKSLGLAWGDEIERQIDLFTAPSNRTEVVEGSFTSIRRDSRGLARTWIRILTMEELYRVQSSLEHEAARYYGPETWATT